VFVKQQVPSFLWFLRCPESTGSRKAAQNGQDVVKDLWQQGDANPHAGPRRSRENQYVYLRVVFFFSFLTAVFIQRSCISSSLTSLSRPFPQSDSTSRQSCTRTSSSTFGYVWGFFGSVVKTVMEHRMSVARTRFALYGDTTTRARRALSLSLTRMTASASTRPSKSSTVSLTTVRCAMRCSLFSQTSRTCPKVKPLYFFFL